MQMINEQIEKLHDKWYDNRKGMPPASWESYLAGWLDAIKHQKDETCQEK